MHAISAPPNVCEDAGAPVDVAQELSAAGRFVVAPASFVASSVRKVV
jgi:hypothetical protein